MTKETAFFAFRRDNGTFSCRGEDLKFTATQNDYFFLWRNGTVYKTRLAINPDRIESIVTEQVNLDYEGFAFVRDRDTGATLAETSPPFADAQQELRVYEHIFDGDADTKFKSYTNNGIRHDVVVKFPEPIDVYGSVTIRAGFHTNKRKGEMLINGVIVRELEAWDGDPQDFTANYTGQINEFSIRQKELNGLQCTAVINYIDIDGARLKSNVNTSKIIMAVGTDMTKYKINMRIKQYNGTVIGKIGAIEEATRTIWLTEVQPFRAGDGIIIEQIVDDMIELTEVQSTDWFACTEQHSPTNHISYKVDGDRFVELFRETIPNFEVLSGNVRMNMRFFNTSTTVGVVRAEDGQVFNCSGNATNLNLPVGNYFIPTLEAGGLRRINLKGTNGNGNFDFKPNFNTSTVANIAYLVHNCRLFNGNVAHLDFSNVENAEKAFQYCTAFNNDIGGGWDMPKATNVKEMFSTCSKFNQPVNQFKFTGASNLYRVFFACEALNQSVRGIEYKDNANLDATFESCISMNHPLDAEELPFPPHVRLMYATQGWSGFTRSIANWTQQLPHQTKGLFAQWSQFNQNVSQLNISNCTHLEYMFEGCGFNNDSVKDWDFTNSRIVSIEGLFSSSPNFKPSNKRLLSNWDTSKITNISYLFYNTQITCNTQGEFDLSDWDTSNVETMARTFGNTNFVKPGISTWNVSNVTNMFGTFQESLVSDDLSEWDVRKVVNMSHIFSGWGRARDTARSWGYSSMQPNIDNWQPNSVTKFQNAFLGMDLFDSFMGPIDLWRWRMPELHGNDSDYSTSDESDPRYQWLGPDRFQYYGAVVLSRPAFGLEPISPTYKPDYTIRMTTCMEPPSNSQITNLSISNHGQVFDSFGRDVKEGSEYSTVNYITKQLVVDVFDYSNGDSVMFGYGDLTSDTSSSSTNNKNWEFAEPFGNYPELVNAPTNMDSAFANRGTRRRWFNVSGFEYIDTSNVTCMSNLFLRHSENSTLGEVNITNWDVSNVTNMENFVGNSLSSSIRFGDLRGWCVQNIPGIPGSWPSPNTNIVEKDPCWGECPLPGEIGTCGAAPANKPMPIGAWNSEDQQYYITIDERAAGSRDQWYVQLEESCQLWRADRGTQNFSKRSNANYFYLDLSYDWIVTSRFLSSSITFSVSDGPFKFLGADTTNVTNMANMFKNSTYFNDDIGWWDTANVRNMRNMFDSARSFNQNLSGWDVSSVSCARDYDRNTYDWDDSYKPNL